MASHNYQISYPTCTIFNALFHKTADKNRFW